MSEPNTQPQHAAGTSTIDPEEVERFSRIAAEWWDEKGKFAPLHRINPLRIDYIRRLAGEHFLRDTAQLAPFGGVSLVDIGCGGGLISEPMARMGFHVTGIDASEKNIAVASLHAQQSGVAVTYRAAAAETLASEGTLFDCVLALEIIEHVADLEAFYDAITALVKPGGLLVLSTINRTAKAYAMAIIGAEYVMRWLPRGTHSWQKFVRPSEMAHALTQRGMVVADTQGMVFDPLKWKFSLHSKDLDVNYLLVARRE